MTTIVTTPTNVLAAYYSGKPNLFSVSYDLRLAGQNYRALIDEIERMGGIRVQQSTWLVTSYAASSVALRDRLLAFIDSNDSVLVTRVVDIAGYEGNPAVRAWIQKAIEASVLVP